MAERKGPAQVDIPAGYHFDAAGNRLVRNKTADAEAGPEFIFPDGHPNGLPAGVSLGSRTGYFNARWEFVADEKAPAELPADQVTVEEVENG